MLVCCIGGRKFLRALINDKFLINAFNENNIPILQVPVFSHFSFNVHLICDYDE